MHTPFDFDAARNGAAVSTRDGKPVRLVCFDMRHPVYTLLGLVTLENGEEEECTFTAEGSYHGFDVGPDGWDLVMAAPVQAAKQTTLW